MIRILGCITQQHDLRLVILAAMVCAFGSYTAMSFLDRARDPGNKRATLWIVSAAGVGGTSVWATHFVAMLAYHSGMVVGYDVALTALSVTFAIALSLFGFVVAQRWRRPLAGGAIFGVAVGAMHYTGMAALNVAARFDWDAGDVVASVVIGIVLGAAAFAVFSRGLGWRGRVAAAGLMTLAIAGHHFTAMTALALVPDPTVAVTTWAVVPPEWLGVVITAVMFVIVGFGLCSSAVDHHLAVRAALEADRLRKHIVELEATKRELESSTAKLSLALDSVAAASQAKSQFLATMSHELRTPLNAIIGFSEMIRREVFGPLGDGRYLEYIKDVQESGQHLLSFVNDVLDFSKVEAGRLELQEDAVELTEVMSDITRMMRAQADAGRVGLEAKSAVDLPQLFADERRVRQIMINLVSNAIKFTLPGGQVTISGLSTVDGLGFRVADTGIGIAKEDIPRVLERFSQVDNSLSRKHDGTGLGLPLAKRLVEVHGGTLTIESELRVGTTVTVKFPLSRAIAKSAAA